MISKIFSAVAKVHVHKVAEIKKKKWKWNPPCAIFWQDGVWHKVVAPYFNFIIYTVQLYEKDCTILQIWWAVALSGTQQIVVIIKISDNKRASFNIVQLHTRRKSSLL